MSKFFIFKEHLGDEPALIIEALTESGACTQAEREGADFECCEGCGDTHWRQAGWGGFDSVEEALRWLDWDERQTARVVRFADRRNH